MSGPINPTSPLQTHSNAPSSVKGPNEPKPPAGSTSGKGFGFSRSTLLSSSEGKKDDEGKTSPTSSTGSATLSTISTHSVGGGTQIGSFISSEDEEEGAKPKKQYSLREILRARSVSSDGSVDAQGSPTGLPKISDGT